MLGRMAKSVKDGALAVGLRAYVNDKLKEYGEVLDCQIDTSKNTLSLRAQLRGDPQPVSATIKRYELEREDGEVYFSIKAVETSREWVTLLLNKLLIGRRFKIPSKVAGLL
ncbi:hypothetical protein SAMN04488038_11092 [Solimonas aquatica]|uniref:Uncharacterized protein n=1 Tax=Solimonas aquatica TaxID=489703 RepID=A0A1H9IMI0_9GAMM|nr:hypothetical protein [Solimonas aquatica]SEQ75605.1 hypothetical protein SAMN04488038_11092 [Solimonas aquatica]